MYAMTLMTQPTYLEAFAHVSPYFYNPPLPNGFITRELVKGKIWNIFSEIILTLWHATVISVWYDCRWSPCLLDRRKLTFTRVASHWCQKYMTSIQDGCCAIKANGGCRCQILGFFGDKFLGIEWTLEAETSTQRKLFIGDDKKYTLFGVTFSFKGTRFCACARVWF